MQIHAEETMFIKKVFVRNFRVFGDEGVEFVFNRGVNAIIGENNTGKSALIDAIRIAFSFAQYANKDIYFNKSDFHVNKEGTRAKTAHIDIYLEEVPNILIDFWNPEGTNDGEFHIKFYTILTPAGIEKVKGQIWGGKVEGNTLSYDSFDAIQISHLGALRDAEDEMRPSRSSRLAKLMETLVSNAESRQDFIDVVADANKEMMKMNHIEKATHTINANLHNIEQYVLQQSINIGFIEPRFESIISALKPWILPRWCYISNDNAIFDRVKTSYPKEEKCYFVKYTHEGVYCDAVKILKNNENLDEDVHQHFSAFLENSFELYQNGLGYNNLLFMSTVLGDMSASKEGIYLNLLLIEEPEAHLHPQLQELIHSFFEKKHKEQPTVQIIYTSHSPTLVSRVGIEGINLLYESIFSAKCFPLSNLPMDESDKSYLAKYLDVTKSQMLFAKGIVFVEGICEAILLPEFAKILERSFDKYAVEVVNVDGTAFKPFASLLCVSQNGECFARAAIITDDDRCTDKKDKETYISKDIDFDDDISTALSQIEHGTGSDRFLNIQKLCCNKNIDVYHAKKTLEYELALREANIPYILNAILSAFPIVGKELKSSVESEQLIERKALRIWLFIRARNTCKGQFAQSLLNEIQKYYREKGSYSKPFDIPQYIKHAIYAVTESE